MMVRVRSLIVGVAAAALLAAVLAPASFAASHLVDCGKLTAAGGFGGPLPKGVPTGSTPSIHAFRVKGSLACGKVRSVMQAFEKNATSTLTINNPPAPGWKCSFSKKAEGYVCRSGGNVIEDQLVWKLHGQTVGPRPRTP